MFETISYSKQKAFLSVSETARLLGVSYYTILKLVCTGQIPAVKIGRRYIKSRRFDKLHSEQYKTINLYVLTQNVIYLITAILGICQIGQQVI